MQIMIKVLLCNHGWTLRYDITISKRNTIIYCFLLQIFIKTLLNCKTCYWLYYSESFRDRLRTSESVNRFSETNCSNEPTHRIDSDIPSLAGVRAGKWRFLPKSFLIRVRRNTALRAIGVSWCQSKQLCHHLSWFSSLLHGDHIGRQGKKCQRDEGIVGHVNTKCKMFTSSSTHWRAVCFSIIAVMVPIVSRPCVLSTTVSSLGKMYPTILNSIFFSNKRRHPKTL